MQLTTILMTGIRTQLQTNNDLVNHLTEDSVFKVFPDVAPSHVSFPYVLVVPMWGGAERKSPRKAFDTFTIIKVVTVDQSQMFTIENLISDALDEQFPTYPQSFSSNFPAVFISVFRDVGDLQGQTVYVGGGVYRFRGNKVD